MLEQSVVVVSDDWHKFFVYSVLVFSENHESQNG